MESNHHHFVYIVSVIYCLKSNGTYSSYDMPPKIPFFTGLKAGQERKNSSTSTPAVRAITTATTSSTTTEAITTTVSMPQSMDQKYFTGIFCNIIFVNVFLKSL
jgi:hypothetical protein